MEKIWRFLMSLSILLCSIQVSAQQIEASGMVKDSYGESVI